MMKFSLERFAFPGWRYALVALVVIAAGGYFFFGNGADTSETLVITRSDFREHVSVSGTVTAARDAALGFAANGRIFGVYAKVGQRVAAGTKLAEIENDDLAAALTEEQAKLASLVAGTRPEEVTVASATVTNAQAALVDAIRSAYTTADDAIHNKADTLFTNPRTANPKLTFSTSDASLKAAIELNRAPIEPVLEKWKLLAGTAVSETATAAAGQSQSYLTQVTTLLADLNAAINQGIPDATVTSSTLSSYQTTVATARTNVNTAATTLTADINALDSALKNLALKQAGSTSEDIAAQQAKVENARAALAKTLVVAPFGGIITRMDATVGEIVSPSVSLISLQSDGLFQIETFVPEVAIARIAVGNPATTTLDAYGAKVTFPAVVVAVDPAETVKDGVPTYKTTLAFLKADPAIRSGMSVDADIETGMLKDAIVIPSGAVGLRPAGRYVSVVTGGTTETRPVETGATPSLGLVEIISGLSEGDVILLAPAAP